MAHELLLTVAVDPQETNEGSDETMIQVFFLTYDGDVAVIEKSFRFCEHRDQLPEDRRSLFFRSPTFPKRDNPYLAIIFRAVELDNTSETDRAANISSVERVLHNLPPRPKTDQIRTAINSLQLHGSAADNDDLLGTHVVLIENLDTLVTGPVPALVVTEISGPPVMLQSFSMRREDAIYHFQDIHLQKEESEVIDNLHPDVFENVTVDTEARGFISQASKGELASLTALEANHLLKHLFSGTTGDEDEKAIVDMVAALPRATVRTLATDFGRTFDAYDSEVDGAHWDELRPILARSLSVT